MTESEDANQLVDARVAPIDVDMENVAELGAELPIEEPNNAPIVNVESPSQANQTVAEMQFSPPYMEQEH